MATTSQINSMNQNYDKLKAFDKKIIFKENLGEESISQIFNEDYDKLFIRLEKIRSYAENIPNNLLNLINNNLSNLIGIFTEISNQKSTQEYINNKVNFINRLRTSYDGFEKDWPSVISIIMESKGFLDDEGIKNIYDKLMLDLKESSKQTITEIKEESDKILNEAKIIAKQIEEKARKTAAKISVEDAQLQFKEAQLDHLKSVKLWTWLSIISLLLFIGIAAAFYFDLPKIEEGLMIYKTVIRATILVALGAMATFCLKILRSSYHMYKHNQHRQRIANSIGSFVESAVTPEQRDLILTHLVESIANFGNSGLVHGEDDNINASKFVVDNIIRNISHKN